MNNLPKVIEPVGLDDLRKVVGDDSSPGARKIASQLTVVPSTTWNLHSTNQNFAQLETERLSIPPVLQKQRISSTVWKTVVLAGNSKQSIAAGVCKQYVKDRTGVHRSLVVSLSDN